MKNSFMWLLLCILCLLCTFPESLGGNAFAQAQDGNLVGSILDPTGAAVPNAHLAAESITTGVKAATTSDASGFYRFNNLLVGAYRITASGPGFATAGLNDVQVELNKTTTANILLSVRGTATEVNVTGAISLIDTTTAQVTNTYFTQMIADLPLTANPSSTG